ncbi:hypothetical protein CBR_g38748 [Chara braunii]|uniref:Integrase catalytic domain-containing protein n=1 Tax=Chara braunii TaxID=69332 RepID=A0A388LQ67_CHABU|nr:hypothetical protein CBR_g38748 [Chara braunii]|eukprot:GBG84464.1 hypothetical protein CBR_g38748 [Chara braunii]
MASSEAQGNTNKRCLAQIEAEEQRLLAVEAARIQAEEAAAAEKLRLQADAEVDAQARRKEAQDLLQRHEANSIDRLKYWHFQPNGDDATPEEKHKEFLSKLVTRLLYACNYQRSELERQHRDLTQQHQELATLRRTVQSHEDATRALNARLLDLEQAVPGPAAGASTSAPSSRQLEDRVDHVVAMLGDISTFSAPTTTISSQLHTLKTEVQKLQSTNADDNPKMYKMPTFNLERLDDYTQQDPVLWWEAFTTQLRILPVAKHAYIGALFLNSKGGCQTWLSHLATSHGVDIPDLKDVITWEELTRLWKKRFIVPFVFDDDARQTFQALKTAMLMAPILSIYDPTLPTRVTTDASGYGIGAVLEQHDGEDWHPVEYFSHKVPPINSLDDARKKELLAFVMALKRWRHFLLGRRRFTWVTDNNPLTYYKTQDTVSSTIGRWMYFIDQFDFTPKHVDGLSYHAADALSRRPDLCAMTHHAFAFVEDLQRHFIRGYHKPRNRNPYGELRPMPIPREPGISIAMDVTGPFPRDRLGHDGILTVVDRLSKYARFLPCKYYSTAPELARLLHTGWICGHGVPEDIVSDRDTRFMSTFWTSLMQESGTTMKPSSARHPQTDEQMEQAHQTAQMMLRTLIRPDQKDWVDRLPDIEFGYNTSVHPAIGVTPFGLHHGGRKGRIFADLLLPRPADIDAACSPASVRKYRELLAQARTNMQKAQVRMQQQANRRRVPCPIRAGDRVWVSSKEFALEQDVSRKLLPKWFGPWTVTSAAGDEPVGPSFVIDIPEHLTVHPVFHASKLATYTPTKSDDFPGRRSQNPPSMVCHQEVDRVISDRKYGSKPRQYKVTFRACDPDDTRWISGADLKASAPLIYAHYERQRLAKGPPRPAPPTRTVVPPSDRQLRPRR